MSDIFWIWIAVIVFSVFFEWMTQLQLVTIWSGIGALVSLILELFNVDMTVQIIVFFSVTVVLLILTKPFAKRMSKFEKTPTNADMSIGKTGKVTKIIDEEMGIFRVRLDSCDWSSVTEDKTIPPLGSEVTVLRIEGVKLVVQPAQHPSVATAH